MKLVIEFIQSYRLYVVTHGESSTVQDNNIDFGYIELR